MTVLNKKTINAINAIYASMTTSFFSAGYIMSTYAIPLEVQIITTDGLKWKQGYLDRSTAFLTSDDFLRSNEIIRVKWTRAPF